MKTRKRTQDRYTASTKQGKGYDSWKQKIADNLVRDHKWPTETVIELFQNCMADIDWWWDARNDKGETFGARYSARNIDDQYDYHARIEEHIEIECGTAAATSITVEEYREQWLVNKETDRINNAQQGAAAIIKEHGFPSTSKAGQQAETEKLTPDGRQREIPSVTGDSVGNHTMSVETPQSELSSSELALSIMAKRMAELSKSDPEMFMLQANQQAKDQGHDDLFSEEEMGAIADINKSEADIPTLPEEPGVTVESLGSDDPDANDNSRRIETSLPF